MNLPFVPEDVGMWNTIKQASQVIVDFSNFVKTLFTDPMVIVNGAIHGLQGSIFQITLITIAVIILLRMIGFENLEKWGILMLIVYVVIMVL